MITSVGPAVLILLQLLSLIRLPHVAIGFVVGQHALLHHERKHPLFTKKKEIVTTSTTATTLKATIEDKDTSSSTTEEDEETAAVIKSLTLCNVDKDNEPDILCDFLMELGACSTAIIDADRGTPLEQPLFKEFDPTNPSSEDDDTAWHDSLHWAAPIWNRCNVTAHFPASINLEGVVDLIADIFPDQYPIENYKDNIDSVPDKDWVIHVQQSWKPIVIGPFVLRFPWHTNDDVQETIQQQQQAQHPEGQADEEVVELKLQGGIAFGTGEHPTTQLCLEWLHQQIKEGNNDDNNDNEKLTVMDYGAGSGILGMAACAIAPTKVRSVGIDIDVDAIQIANANAIDNGVDMKNYLPPLPSSSSEKTTTPGEEDEEDVESKSLLLKAHAHAQKQLKKDGSGTDDVESLLEKIILPHELSLPIYDVCVANILAGPLCALASTIASLVKPTDGKLAMSGILPQQVDAVIEAYEEFFDNVKLERTLGGWCLITGTRKSS